MSGLTLTEIEEFLANDTSRATYKPAFAKFFDSGELALDLTERFGENLTPQSLRNSAKVNLEKNFANREYRIMLVGDRPEKDGEDTRHVILVNMQVYAAAKAKAEQPQ